jgi:disulfide bond formation protein DsbB
MSQTNLVPSDTACSKSTALANVVSLALAGVATTGSIYLSVGLGLKACPLCFYQRSFAIAVLVVLGMLIWLEGLRSMRACLVTLPLTMSGLGVAAFHVYLVQNGKLECPPALFGWGDGPIQSLSIFAVLTIVCLTGACSTRRAEVRGGWPTILAAMIVGVGTAWVCIASAPPLPPTPGQPYDPIKQPFDMCRPPFRGV